jgi:hypothetical protein
MGQKRSRRSLPDRRTRGLAHVRARMLRHGHPRAQMLALLVVTGGCGFLASWAMLRLGVGAMGVRYPAAVVFAYGAFLLLLRLWLWSMMRDERRSRPGTEWSTDSGSRSSPGSGSWSLPDFAGSGGGSAGGGGGGPSGGGGPRFGGGGAFAGGGAGGEWAPAPTPVVMPTYTPPAPRPALQGLADAPLRASRGGGAKGGGKGSGFSLGDLDVDDDSGAVIAVALLALAAAAVVAAASWAVVVAPALLAEVAVDGIVVSGLYRRVRAIDDRQWLRTAVRRTWIPTLLIALLLCAVGFTVQNLVPDARSIGDVWRSAHERRSDPLR